MFQFPLPPPSGWRRKNFIHIPAKTGVGGFFCPDHHQEGTANCFIRCISETTSGWQTACFWPLLSQVRMLFQWGYLVFATGMLSRSQKNYSNLKVRYLQVHTCTQAHVHSQNWISPWSLSGNKMLQLSVLYNPFPSAVILVGLQFQSLLFCLNCGFQSRYLGDKK